MIKITRYTQQNPPAWVRYLTHAGGFRKSSCDFSRFWYTERLWQLAANLPIKTVLISAIAEFDQDCWFSAATPPTCRQVALHAQRIYAADLAYPIILSAEGYLMDGGHRLAKAWLMGLTEI